MEKKEVKESWTETRNTTLTPNAGDEDGRHLRANVTQMSENGFGAGDSPHGSPNPKRLSHISASWKAFLQTWAQIFTRWTLHHKMQTDANQSR